MSCSQQRPAWNSSCTKALRANGDLQRILERWNLWDERQPELAETAAGSAAPAPRAGITLGQLALFVRATGATVVISVLSMAVAIAGGLGLSLARRYGAAPLRVAATT